MSKKSITRLLVGSTLLVLILTLAGIAVSWKLHWDQETTSTNYVSRVNDLVVEQVLQYKSMGDREVSVEGAPKPNVGDVQVSRNDTPLPANIENKGYSVVSVAGEMQKRSLESDETNTWSARPYSADNAWLKSSSATDMLIRHAEAAGRDWMIGWVQVTHPIQSKAMRHDLSRFGASVLGWSGNLVRLKLPKNRKNLEAISGLSWVDGIGGLPPHVKLRDNLEHRAQQASASSLIPVFVTVVTSAMDDIFRDEFKQLGLNIGYFDPSIRTYSAAVTGDQIARLAQLDFVQAVEPIAIVKATHDTAVPAMGVDSFREAEQASGVFTGVYGVSTPIAVMDTGLNTNHVAISSLRKSICGANFTGGEDHDLWRDRHGHGSHVTGTVVGNGYFQPRYAGMAPGVEHIRFAKVMNSYGFGSTLNVIEGMDFLAKSSACPEDGWSTDRIKPLVVNMSLGSASLEFDGKSIGPRKLDSIVWTHSQLYVVSTDNRNIYGYSNYGSAKNSLSVGAVYDNGDAIDFSSVGPTTDGRLLPSVVGTGSDVISCEGNASYDGYRSLSGTSMSAPSVTGVAALLMDASPEHREQPALTRARLMASAIKPDAWFTSETLFPKNNTNGPGSKQAKYGMGLVSARTSITINDVPEGWSSSGATVTLEDGEYAYQDIVVLEGTSRLDLVMTWDEPPADNISSTVLNDLDLWVDYDADCGSGSCGEYSSQSRIDNVEWVIIQDPKPGTYRVKIAGERIYTEPPHAALAWTMIRGSSTPQLTLEIEQDTYEVESGQVHDHSVEVVVSTDGFVAAGTELHMDCRTLDDHPCESFGHATSDQLTYRRMYSGLVQREDGIGTKGTNVESMYLGEVAHDEVQRVLLHLSSESSGPLKIYFTATAWNARGTSASVVFRESGSDTEPDNELEPPSNDSYENPTLLEDQEGSLEIDTFLTTSESGEPLGSSTGRRPSRSVWFKWIAEQSGQTSIVANPRGPFPSWYLDTFNPLVDVFQVANGCCGIADGKLIASSDWSAQFFAEQNKEYRIRIASDHASIPLTLNWLFGERPPNDYFADAIALTGSSGTVSGHNLGATIEPGEVYGQLAATIWYRWTAPEDGTWEFQIRDAQLIHILVFTGDTIDRLRLVSGISVPGDPVSVATVQDETYHVMVASPDALSGGWKFDELTWEPQTDPRDGWDWFEMGSRLSTVESGSTFFSHRLGLGVEPNEPESTGIQTGWLNWVAPSSGHYTWYWDDSTKHLVPFSGSAVDELNAIDVAAVASGTEFVFEATEGDEYSISVGHVLDHNQAYTYSRFPDNIRLRWGKTPENNAIGGAIVLNDTEGNVVGSNQFATTNSTVRTHLLGYSSLWYSYEATQTGWYRFWIEGANSTSVLSAFHPKEAGLQPELIMASRRPGFPGEAIEVVVYVEQGTSVLLRVGNIVRHSNLEFELHWAPTDPPQWLIYRGRIADGWRDAAGYIVSLFDPTDLAFNSDGTLLFVATNYGVSMFQRDTETGRLSLLQEIGEPDGNSHLVWDPYRDRLYVNKLDNWWTYHASSQSPMVLDLDRVDYDIGFGSRHRKSTRSPVLFMGNNGDHLYKSTDYAQAIYSFNLDGELNMVALNPVSARAVYPSTDGSHWWKWSWNTRQLLKRELGSGFFPPRGKPWSNERFVAGIGAFSMNDKYFFSASESSISRSNFEVQYIDYTTGELGLTTSTGFNDLRLFECTAAIPRMSSYTVDVLCTRGGYVVEFSPDSGDATMRDYLGTVYRRTVSDRFGRAVPSFQLSGTSAIEASPDGRHVYASTKEHGILIFERFGNEIRDMASNPFSEIARLDLLQASNNQIQFDNDTATDGCISTNEWVVDGVSYSVEHSKWQHRTVDSQWSDIEGTEKSEELCSYSSTESKEYRMVATFTRDGETIEFASNFFGEIIYVRLDSLTVAPGEIELDDLTITECTTISNLIVNGVEFTVHESNWQVRDDSDNDWSDMDSTETAGELCPYDPGDTREYRLVGTFVIDDEEGYYSSNVMQEQAGQS